MSNTVITTFATDSKRSRMDGFDDMNQAKFGIEKKLKMPTSDFINDTHEPTAAVNPTRTYNMMVDIASLGPTSAKCLNSRQIMFIKKQKRTNALVMADLPTAIYRLRKNYEDRFALALDPRAKIDPLKNDDFKDIDTFTERFSCIGVIYASATPSGQYGPHPMENLAPSMTALPVPMSVSASCFFPHVLEDTDRMMTAGRPIYMMFRLVHKDHARPYVSPEGSLIYSNLTSDKNDGRFGVPDVVFMTETPLLVDTTLKSSKYINVQTHVTCAYYNEWTTEPPAVGAPAVAGVAALPVNARGYYERKYAKITKIGNLQQSYHKTSKPFMRQRITPYEILKYDPVEVTLDILEVTY